MLYLIMGSSMFLFSSMTLMMSLVLFLKEKMYFMEWEMFMINSMEFIYIIYLDWVMLLFSGVVLLISSMVILYSNSYMSEDVNKNRFLYLVFLFVLSMLFMIMSPNLFSILLGWDGLGLVSFCLVVYFQNNKSQNAGILTILSNRLGDGVLLILMGLSLSLGTWNFLIYSSNFFKVSDIKFMGLLMILISITKSAQIPFSAWLPAAMAAPTPVSALVHSSTLVTAGVYLLIRFFNLLASSKVLYWLLLLGILTMFMSGLSCLFEFDFKKIIALSTLSQLGLMMSTLGLGLKYLSLFHLLTHAFFKALLFLCAGGVIHSFYSFQDIRYLGNLVKFMPITFSCMMIANFSLMGMFFMSGFYSKDLILEMMSVSYFNFLIYVLFYFCILLTLMYSIRLFIYGFVSYSNYFVLMEFHDEDKFMLKGMIILSLMSVVMGSSLKWLMLFSMKFIYLVKLMKFMVIYFLSLGSVLIYLMMLKYYILKKMMFYYCYSNYMWFLSILSVYGLNLYFLKLGHIFIKVMDFGWSEYLIKLNILNSFNMLMKVFLGFQKNIMKVILKLFLMMIIIIFVFY
uniref:NADH-ubiquinone oxidoreductase chain 5 n=1 Tax=Adicella ragma TaxID=2904898 RepID=A0A9E8LNP1_9NEOP|nr:NADH dehydrogenase subunit 5 [Adicella ragma]UZZ43721.1 NADH dehydrogenase subunit 5 [Adicella ragma]